MAERAVPMIETRTTILNKDDYAFLLACADDTEESPWMVASDPHLLALQGFTVPFFLYVEEQRPDLYASSELAVRYPKPDGSVGTVGPDALAAYAPRRVRNSFDVAREGAFPAFVLEIVSRSPLGAISKTRRGCMACSGPGSTRFSIPWARTDDNSGAFIAPS